jgi:integrase
MKRCETIRSVAERFRACFSANSVPTVPTMKARKVKVRDEIRWVVPLGKRDGVKRVRIFGATEKEALTRAKEKMKEMKEHGQTLVDLSTSHRALMVAWKDRLTVEQMGEAFRRYSETQCTSHSLETAVESYLSARKMEKRNRKSAKSEAAPYSRQHSADIRYRLSRLVAAFPDRTLDSIIPGQLETFLAAQGASARNFYKALHAFFGYARRQRWVASDPFAEVPRPASGGSGEKAIFKPDELKQLLKAAAGLIDGCERHEGTLALLVLGGLCGLRYSEALRLRWPQVDLKGGEIHLDKLKTSKRGLRGRFVKILPAAAAWLATLKHAEDGRLVPVNDKNARRQRARILEAAKLKAWPHNALRRSWGSYHLAAYENADLTAAQMGHTSAETTFAKYRTLARKTEGEGWFALTPTKVQEIENVVPFEPQKASS